MTRMFNRPQEKARRRALRKSPTRAESRLWFRLRSRQLGGLRFRRQYSVGRYIVDFYCAEAKLAIEVDGDSHFGGGAEERDRRRQAFIESLGIKLIRFTNEDIAKRLDAVLEAVYDAAGERRM